MTETLFYGGRIRDVAGERFDWLVTDGGTITALGGLQDDPPDCRRKVDLEGRTLVPGLRDGHVHLPATGLYAAGLDFRGIHSAKEILNSFTERAAVQKDAILFGGNFEDPLDEDLLSSDLDDAVGDRPALLARADMHSCIVSSALLRDLELDAVEGVDRDENGAPTGYLREQAAAAAWTHFDATLTDDQQREAVLAAVDLAYSKGVVQVNEMFVVEWRGWHALEVLRDTLTSVALGVHPLLGTNEVQRVKEMGLDRIGGDYFLDGSFGSHTAWMAEPFSSDVPTGSSATGISYRDDDELYGFFREAQEADMQVGVHAIGDAAIEQCLRTWERVAEEVGIEEVRRLGHRIEHFECAWDDHIRRAAHLGLRASVQPAFDHYWGGERGLYSDRIGWDRAANMNRFASMLAAGMVVGAGSDSTVTPLDPFLQMYSLRAHHVEEQRLDASRALALNTVGVAALEDRAGEYGDIVAGRSADLALLDRDPFEVDPEELKATEVLGTWIGGTRVWPKEEAEAR